MNKLTRISATVASSVALVAGFAGIAGAAPSIDTTGPDSLNRITHRNDVRTRVSNDNDVRLTNNNPQTAVSGDTTVRRNTTAGGVTTGSATNDSFVDATVDVDNTSSSSDALNNAGSGGSDLSDASIENTGPDSTNVVSSRNTTRTTVENTNTVRIENNNSQTAVSGDAHASRNTTVGDVSTGDAENVSTATFEVSVSN